MKRLCRLVFMTAQGDIKLLERSRTADLQALALQLQTALVKAGYTEAAGVLEGWAPAPCLPLQIALTRQRRSLQVRLPEPSSTRLSTLQAWQ